ncbi:MAG: type I DNA topoisomerase [bacterium]
MAQNKSFDDETRPGGSKENHEVYAAAEETETARKKPVKKAAAGTAAKKAAKKKAARKTTPRKKAAGGKTTPRKKAAGGKATPRKKAAGGKATGKKAAGTGTGRGKTSRKRPAGSMSGKSLVIVESPAKAQTINRFLGPSYGVMASLGHVRDLPKTKLGVDLEKNFEPQYVQIRGKGKVVKELRKAAGEAEEVYLAVDMDREGEAIAWHLAALLERPAGEPKRVIFNEITPEAIREAFANPTTIDMRKVNAQQARRVLDRLVGYMVSPLLWKVVRRGASAGRVQSVALRLIVEREEAIEQFKAREYWTVEGEFQSPRGDAFTARLEKVGKAKAEFESLEKAREIQKILATLDYSITALETKPKRRNPKPPFITSTLQQDASYRLGFNPRRTMRSAQQLYEGIDIGEKGRVGLITYMRTDSVRIADSAIGEAREFISRTFGDSYLPDKSRHFKQGKKSQDAHEAIRPTNVGRTPDDMAAFLGPDQARLYRLIWERFVASQMSPAVFEVTTVEILARKYLFRVSGSVIKFDGFLKIYGDRSTDDEKKVVLPVLEEGDILKLLNLADMRHETQPPPRFTDASLIRELEEKGIGRPSTYAAIIGTVIERGYVERERRTLSPTELGRAVLSILLRILPDIFEVGFTARMETELDKVESGEDEWVQVVNDFYKPFSEDMKKANSMKAELKGIVTEEVDVKCETCGKPMVKRWGRHGQFLACSGFPECKTTKPLDEDDVKVEAVCPECGGEMVARVGRYGRFLACKRYPECKGTRAFTLGIKCPVEGCDGELKEKRTKKGRVFYGCDKFPKCKFATWDKPVERTCPECSYGILVQKTAGNKAGRLKCPRCKHEVDE